MPRFADQDRHRALRCLRGACAWALLAVFAAVSAQTAPDAGLKSGLAAAAGAVDPSAPAEAKLDERAALRAAQAAIGREVADHTLLDRQSKPVRLSSYRGKPLVVSFIYTGCFQVCPASTRALHEAVKGLDKLLGPNQYNVVSIGFNQPFDSPTAMRDFAAQHRIDAANWEFLSPHRSTVDALTRDFGFSYQATPAGFDHVLGVTVLDGQGRVYTQVFGDRLTADQLGEPLKQLLGRAPLAQAPTFSGVLERVRILCTVYDPETGQYRYNYALLFEVLCGLAFFLTVGGYFLAEWREVRQRRRAGVDGSQRLPASGPLH
ncbi:MAG: SCO family protein [Ideonella sp.]|nr:SCO family protein [Ideonella sp.]